MSDVLTGASFATPHAMGPLSTNPVVTGSPRSVLTDADSRPDSSTPPRLGDAELSRIELAQRLLQSLESLHDIRIDVKMRSSDSPMFN